MAAAYTSGRWAAIALGLALLASAAMAAKPAPALLQQCAACHGVDGNTTSALLYPNLAGQAASYIALQLNNFRSGERPHAQMRAVAEKLSQADIVALAAWYAARSPKPQRSVDAALESQGRAVFERGNAAGAMACVACHGPQGQGQAQFPRIASQPAVYSLEQLKVYRNAPSFNNPLAMLMKSVAVKLSDQDMRAVSAYLATLK